MATGGLYGSTSTGTVAPQSGSESVGLYGNNTVFGGSYFEYLIFLDSASTPATPTGGSWSFVTNTGTPPTGWSNNPPQAPTGKVWISIALVNSKSTATLTWSTPGIFANPAGTGTVTSVAALTLTTAGTDVSSTVANSTTSPVITLNLPTASATNRGALSAADWTTFNNKGSGTVTSVTGTSPVVSSGGNTPAISMAAANATTSGYLTSTDWNTFNNKGAGTVTSVSGTTGRVTSTGGITPVIDLASGVATPGTTGSSALVPVITVDTYGRVTNITTAANPQGTVTSVTGTAPVVSSGGATPAISMAAATASVSGYLTSTDWSTFNSKGSGSVTSVAATVPSFLSITGSPITTSGTLAISYSGTALPVANGGTGVTASSGANSVVLRDANVNISVNSISEGYSNVAAAGATTTLTVASAPNYVVTGSGGQTYQLPDATTLANGVNYTFNNNQSSGTIVVKNNSSATIATIQSGGLVDISLLSNATAAGSWDVHNLAPSNVSWSTNTFDYPGSITSATWNGVAVAINRGGTGQTTQAAAITALAGTQASGQYLRSNGTNTLLSAIQAADVPTLNQNTTGTASNVTGTVAIANGGTGATTAAAALTNLGAYPASNPSGYGTGTVTSVAASVPSFLSVSGSPITTAGTLAISYSGTALPVANGGTGQTTASAAFNALSPITTTGDIIIGNGTNSATRLPIGANTYVLTSNGTTATWAASSGGSSITISNDTSTASSLYPAFFSATSGTASTVYTSNAKLLYKPSTGELQASEITASNGLILNATTVAASYTIGTGFNAMSVGPVTVASGQAVTVSSGQRWLVF